MERLRGDGGAPVFGRHVLHFTLDAVLKGFTIAKRDGLPRTRFWQARVP
jgi:hypothetical protein